MSEYEGSHETRDIPARVPAYIFVFTAVFVPLGALAIWLMLGTVWRAPAEPPPVFPPDPAPQLRAEPPLQRSPPADMARLDARHEQRLRSVGWVDRNAGIVHMPIERAMDLLVQRGLPASAPDGQPRPTRQPSGPQQGGGSP